MPEFVMEGRDHAARAESAFVLGFIEAMFFTECSTASIAEWYNENTQACIDEGSLDGCLPSDAGYSEIHPDSLAAIRRDCEAWQAANAALLEQAYATGNYDESQAGRDYWFTRNGHGAGFWDRGLGDIGDKLSEACRYNEVYPFFGYHVTHGDAPFVHVDL